MSDSTSQSDRKVKLYNCYVCQFICHLDKDRLYHLNSSYPLNYADQLVTGLTLMSSMSSGKSRHRTPARSKSVKDVTQTPKHRENKDNSVIG